MTHHFQPDLDAEVVEANDYDEGDYGDGAYGRDFDPYETDWHFWEIPRPGTVDYASPIGDLVELIDFSIKDEGPIDTRPPMSGATTEEPRIFLAESSGVDGRPELYFEDHDTNSWRRVDFEPAFPLDNVAHTNHNEQIEDNWIFTRTIQADIGGDAGLAEEVDKAGIATDTELLEGNDSTSFCPTDDPRTVTSGWTYVEEVTVEGGLDASDATDFSIPAYQD